MTCETPLIVIGLMVVAIIAGIGFAALVIFANDELSRGKAEEDKVDHL